MDPQEDKLRAHSAPLTMNREVDKCRNDVGRGAAKDDHLKFCARVGTLVPAKFGPTDLRDLLFGKFGVRIHGVGKENL